MEGVCDRLLRYDNLPDSGGTPATVIITIDIEDPLNGTGCGLTSHGTLIRTEQVRAMTDQAEAFYAFMDRNGEVLNLGRTRRIASRGQSAALYARDGGCSFPGRGTAPEWSERHHVIPWIEGGPTDLNNLTLLCVYHLTVSQPAAGPAASTSTAFRDGDHRNGLTATRNRWSTVGSPQCTPPE